MYKGANQQSVRTVVGNIQEALITVNLHQGSALSLYLFTLVMNELTNTIQDEVPWCMLFADNIVLIDQNHQLLKYEF